MMLLPPIPEKTVLKTIDHRRHSIDTRTSKSTADNSSSITSKKKHRNDESGSSKYISSSSENFHYKSSLKTKFRNFDNVTRNEFEPTQSKVKFFVEEKDNKLPTLSENQKKFSNNIRDDVSFMNAKLYKSMPRSAQFPVKPGISLTTTMPARVSKTSQERKPNRLMSLNNIKQPQFSSLNEYNLRKVYLNKNDTLRRSISYTDRIENTEKKRRKQKKEKQKREDKEKEREDDDDEYEYVDDDNKTAEVKDFISLVKRLQIHEGQTPQPDDLRQPPKAPRLLTNLSVEGQYALMKTYEDTIAEEITAMHPNLAVYVPRVLTSKFRKRIHPPKNLRFLYSRADLTESCNSNNRDSPDGMPKLRKQNSFLNQPFPTQPSDPNFNDHQLTVSQQLEIAQDILDLIKKNKGEYITSSELDENMDLYKAYASYVKIWTKYFHLR